MQVAAVKQEFERAFARLRGGDAEGAVALCRETLVRSPDNIDLLTLLGASLNALRHPDVALEPLQRALEIAPGFARTHEEIGRSLLMLRRVDDAISHLEQALVLSPGMESVERSLAQALLLAGRGEDADRVIEQGFARSPQRKLLLAAAEHQRAGRYRESEPLLRKVLAVEADEVNAMRMLARVAEEAGHLGEAERLLRRAIRLKPGFDDARLNLARVLKDNDQLEEAVNCTAQATLVNPRNPLAHYLHASMLALFRRYEEAIDAYRESIRLRAHNPAAWLGLGNLLSRRFASVTPSLPRWSRVSKIRLKTMMTACISCSRSAKRRRIGVISTPRSRATTRQTAASACA
jgi:tetratricopeptide (TPR) repeat protein